MRRAVPFLAALGALVLFGLDAFRAADDKPKFTIKEVMQKAHKDGLMKKVAGGKATKDEKEELLDLYTALSKNKPPKGDEKDWMEKTDSMVKAAKAAVEDDKAAKDLAKVVNCKACHELHKGK